VLWEGLNKSTLDLSAHVESGACPDSLAPDQPLAVIDPRRRLLGLSRDAEHFLDAGDAGNAFRPPVSEH
jgi:hypothetical protein